MCSSDLHYISDTFGIDTDRFLLVGAIGPCTDMDVAIADLDWVADHDFTATYAPGYMRHADMPRPHDAFWEPYYARCEEHGMPLVVHAGYGWDQGVAFATWKRLYDAAVESAGSTELADMVANPEGWQKLLAESGDFFADIKPRQPMWQMMLGGVFDRHPDLKVMLTEIRADWVPSVLRLLDEVWEANRDDLPARRRPSEYWASNFLVGVSFTHACEVPLRHEIGIEQFTFGRDYPHPESTWPHTREWLHAAFAGVPDDELRLILGENAVRFLDLDRDRLAEVAAQIGPTFAEINSSDPVASDLIAHFDQRGGYLKPPEGDDRLELVDQMVRDDLAAVRGG